MEGRYQHLGEIGRGGMGAVELVFDRTRGERVARKRIVDPRGVALLRFKTEFRAIERLQHPNLVRLFELDEDASGPFFTMEVVDGVDLATYCRQGDGASLSRVLPALFGALAFLHDHGIVHADLKPANVLVTREGALKLLDFGVLAFTPGGAASGGRAHAALGVAGTPAYMAAELFEGAPPSRASDVYALGVMLQRLVVPAHATPGASSAFARMLARDPRERPTLEEVAAAFGVAWERTPASMRSAPRALVGRDDELDGLLAHLDAAHAGQFAAIALVGKSGIGKTALANELARIASRGGAVVLRGRAHLRERLLFNGIDEAVDDLARELLAPSARALDAASRGAAAQASVLFPALAPLGEVRTHDHHPASTPRPRPTVGVSDRASAFAAFLHLLETVAEGAGALLLVLDDAQWLDADAAALLDALLERRPARVLLVATLRSDLPSLGSAAPLVDSGRLPLHEVSPLDVAAIEVLLEQSLAAHGVGALEPGAVARLARLADGRPMLAELGVRALLDEDGARVEAAIVSPANAEAGATKVADPIAALTRRLERLPDLGRRVVATLVAFDGWLDGTTLAASLDAKAGLVHDALVTLEQKGVVRIALHGGHGRGGAGDQEGQVDFFHDLVRVAALGSLARADLAAAHSGLCDALASLPHVPPARLVRHYVGAGRDGEAAAVASVAARDAIDKHAYGLALELLDVALRGAPSDRSPLLRMRAHAFESFGQYADAASAYAELATRSPEADARSARLGEASALLAAGAVAEGRTKADALLARGGGALAGAWARGVAVAQFLLGPRSKGPAPSPDRVLESLGSESASLEAEREERLASVVAWTDPLAGLAHILHARRRLDRIGEFGAAAMCEFQLAYFAYYGEARGGAVRLAERYREAGEARLRHAIAHPPRRPLRAIAVAFPTFLVGVDHERHGRQREAATHYHRALAMIAGLEQNGTYEQMTIALHLSAMSIHDGDLPAARRAYEVLRAANGGHAASVVRPFLDVGSLELAVLEGDFEGGAAAGALALKSHPPGASLQRTFLHLGVASFAAYAGDPIEARRAIVAHLRANARFRVLQNMYAARYVGKLALLFARARRAGDRTVTRREMARLASIARRAPPMSSTAALRAYAYVDELEGADRTRVLAQLVDAEAIASAHHEPVDAAIARYQRGVRADGHDGEALRASAREALAGLGVSPRVLDEHELIRPRP